MKITLGDKYQFGIEPKEVQKTYLQQGLKQPVITQTANRSIEYSTSVRCLVRFRSFHVLAA